MLPKSKNCNLLRPKIKIIILYFYTVSKTERSISVKSETPEGSPHSRGSCSDQKSILLTGTSAGPVSCRRADRIACTAIACGTTARRKSLQKRKRTIRFSSSGRRALRCVSSNREKKLIITNKTFFFNKYIMLFSAKKIQN